MQLLRISSHIIWIVAITLLLHVCQKQQNHDKQVSVKALLFRKLPSVKFHAIKNLTLNNNAY